MPRVLVANTLDASVTFFDATTRKRLKTLKVGGSPQGIALARNGKFGYVTNAADGTISVIDVIRMSETARLEPDGLVGPAAIAVLPDGRTLFVASAETAETYLVDASSGTPRRNHTLPGTPCGGVAVVPSGDRIWIADPDGEQVVGLDPRNGDVVRHAMAGAPSAVALARDNRTLLVALRQPSVLARVDPDDGRVLGQVEVGANPIAIAAHPYADQAFVVARGGGSVFPIDTATMTAGRPISVGLGPTGVALARAGKILYVTNAESDSVSVVDVQKANVRETWDTGHHPSAVAFIS